MAAISAAQQTGRRGKTVFAMAVEQYKFKEKLKPSLHTDLDHLKPVMSFIGHLTLEEICDEVLEPFIAWRKSGRYSGANHLQKGKWVAKPIKDSSINHTISRVQTILNMCATSWRNEQGQYWLEKAPTLTLIEPLDTRKCQAIEWDTQKEMLELLPDHLRSMALFVLNTGVRDDVVCNLQWDWIEYLPEMDWHVIVVPPQHVKARKKHKVHKIIVPNSLAWEVIEQQRDKHDQYIFTYKKGECIEPITEMCNSAWETMREALGMPKLRPHDLRATVATRLQEIGADKELVRWVLWHGNKDVTDGYTLETMRKIFAAMEKIKEESEYRNICENTVIARHLARKSAQAKQERENRLRPPATSDDSLIIVNPEGAPTPPQATKAQRSARVQ